MYKSIAELVAEAHRQRLSIGQLMIGQEMEETGRSRQEVLAGMQRNLLAMQQAAEIGLKGTRSHSGMTGGDAKKLEDYRRKGNFLTDSTFVRALSLALANNEVNASMGVVCATPTAGSCGVLPGVLLMLKEKFDKSDAEVVEALFTAGAVGFVIANNAFLSGAAGGCQAEVGSASAMAAAAAVELCGGRPEQAAHAMAIAMKNLLGLACDPLAGLVEVPCIKRNAGGTANALAAAEMAMAGIESNVAWDEVIEAMYQIGQQMPQSLKETAQGGLAATQTGKRWKQMLLQPRQEENLPEQSG